MALVKPIAQSQNAFDSTQSKMFYFSVNGGSQVVKNRLTIRNNSTNEVIYQNIAQTYRFEQELPSNTLTNGVYYNYYFNTYDSEDNMSENSNVVSFYCYTTPTVSFTNLSNNDTITNVSYDFTVQYAQTQSELLDFLTINLYSSSNILISSSGNLYSNEIPPIDFNYEFSGFENNESYKIQAIATTVNGTIIYSSIINFNVIYVAPTLFSTLSLENKSEKGYVQIQSNMIIADGESNINPMKYIYGVESGNYIQWGESYSSENSVISQWATPLMADIRFPNEYILWSEGHNINKDFEISMWIKPTWIYRFCEFFKDSNNGYTVKFIREIPYGESTVKDYFELSGYKDGVLNVYQRSNYVNIMSSNDYVLIFIKKVGTNYTLTLQIIEKGNLSSIDWGINNSNVDFNTLTTLNWYGESYTQGLQPIYLNNDMDSIFPIDNFKIYSAIYDNLDVTKDTTKVLSTTFPSWDYNTELNCDFNGNINGGNVNVTLQQLSGIKLKRREVGNFDWLSIYEKSVSSVEDLTLIAQDKYLPNNKDYQWALVPILQQGIEGDYITNSLTTCFDGTFISNGDTIFKLYNSVVYSGGIQNIRVGQLQPIGLEYPILLQNGKVNYFSNTVSADLYGYTFEETRKINRRDVIQQADDLIKILTSGKAFCLSDWNGNIWIGRVNSAPNVSYNSSYANGIINISFTFVEQGKYNNEKDLIKNGLL